MTQSSLSIPILLGTNRKGRQSEKVARWLLRQAEAREDITPLYFDVADFAMPQDDQGNTLGELFPEWRDAVIAADALIIVAPEYNHGYPGILKSVLDTLLKEYVHKAVGLVGVSAGPWGGTRVIESLLPVVRELGLTVTFTDLHFPRVRSLFDGDGEISDPAFEKRASGFFDELVWMGRTLRWGRANLPSKYHEN
ncbi:MAG TPA: NAD(P)H-dependent oxidoreductase [Pyrinomonadaceae bacterium]|nr:NAD(P)H-dependent oxidoreductase [Pyrinomonadaceae bacterium]HMP65071.1 NAD(P)H-dependent oxidoreductase [Pyrinomonadaceae bacterium]